ncbi:PepSY domain-containing protein [Microbacterium oxydans]|uniref:PepSY domain-containing protein n=1 Tax=Microbacterium sp. B19(2022) TaxID=2914045 RepID=UPI00142FCCD5|nr:PepSY domain-containing protein [Microbacterium sp. B19(2022)]NJI61055.1 PepSY domain-containing protein [Microbacterium sp. B19(2022)]
MDDKTPTPDQTPDQTPASTPDAQTVPVAPAPPATAPTVDAGQHPTFAAAEPVAAPAASEAKPGRKRALLIGGGIAAAVILAGGGIAVGAAIGDEFGDDDDRSSMSDGPRHDEGAPQGDHDDDRQDDDSTSSNDRGPVTGIGTASADELIEIADAARGAAEGEVTSIDAKRDGTWEVQLTTTDGTETDVRVDENLAASVIETDPADGDDTGPALTLDDAAIRSLVDAALAEADGMITDLDVDGDDVSPYDASVLTSDNRSIDIDFSADFAVVGTDID